MAIPVIGAVTALIGGMTASEVYSFAKRIAFAAAALAGFVFIWIAFHSAINTALGPIWSAVTTLPPILQTAFKVLPSNIDECISAVITIQIAYMVFNASMRGLEYMRGS